MDLITAAQCRAARALLNWSQPELARLCAIHVQTISAFEQENSTPTNKTLQKIAVAFENAGVEFLPDSGLRKKAQNVKIYQGRENWANFYKDIYDTAAAVGGEFCVSNVRERDFMRWFVDEAYQHIGQMEDIARANPKFTMRILIEEGDDFMPASGYAAYRQVKSADFKKDVSFYVYGDRLAIMIFEPDDIYICVVQNQKVADAYKSQFNLSWAVAKDP